MADKLREPKDVILEIDGETKTLEELLRAHEKWVRLVTKLFHRFSWDNHKNAKLVLNLCFAHDLRSESVLIDLLIELKDFLSLYDALNVFVLYDTLKNEPNRIVSYKNMANCLNKVCLHGYSLKWSIFYHADFSNSKLTQISAEGSILVDCCFKNVEIKYSNFSLSNLNGTCLSNAFIRSSNFKRAMSDKGNFTNALITGSFFRYAQFTNSKINEIRIQSSNFNESNLGGSNLTGASIQESSFSGARLVGADLSGGILYDLNLENANSHSIILENTSLTKVNFSNTVFRRAKMNNAHMSGTNFHGAMFMEAHLIDADLRNTNLTQADFSVTTLNGADLKGANLTGAALFRTYLENTRIDEETLANTKKLRVGEIGHNGLVARHEKRYEDIDSVTLKENNSDPASMQGKHLDTVLENLRNGQKKLGAYFTLAAILLFNLLVKLPDLNEYEDRISSVPFAGGLLILPTEYALFFFSGIAAIVLYLIEGNVARAFDGARYVAKSSEIAAIGNHSWVLARFPKPHPNQGLEEEYPYRKLNIREHPKVVAKDIIKRPRWYLGEWLRPRFVKFLMIFSGPAIGGWAFCELFCGEKEPGNMTIAIVATVLFGLFCVEAISLFRETLKFQRPLLFDARAEAKARERETLEQKVREKELRKRNKELGEALAEDETAENE